MKKLTILLLSLIVVTAASAKGEDKKEADQAFDAFSHMNVYNAALRELEINYVDTLKHEKLLQRSLDNMLYGLDPYTVFIPKSETEMLKQMQAGEYGGIGSVISYVDGKTYLSDPYYGMPAQANGLRAGDELVEINGEKCKGKSLSEVSSMLKGKPYTKITITVRRQGEKKLIKKTFLRDIIEMETVPYYAKVADGIGYIVILDFIDRTFADFDKAVKDLVEHQGVKKLIIDLRGNGGGIINAAVDIASLFVPKGTEIVRTQSLHKANNKIYKTTKVPKYLDMPLLFLVDDNTASASEILSGSMQDLDRALIAGIRTFGKGLVQTIRELPNDNYIKITIAKYYLPSGRCIQELDYANRQNGKRETAIPDSLIKEFKTAKGRVVMDGSGIMPDSIFKEDLSYNISHYMYFKHIYFKYANEYRAKHDKIAPPSEFKITDEEYSDFCKYVLQTGFTYRLESEKYLQDLRHMVEIEGYDDLTKELFEELTNKLQPNIEEDLIRFRTDIQRQLEVEIIKRYYYSKGSIEYNLLADQWLKQAIEILK